MMSQETTLRDLFDRWERVWHEGQYDLVPECVGPHYIRHDEAGDRTITREAYAAEIAKLRTERPDIRVVVYDHSFKGDRAWFRLGSAWTDAVAQEHWTSAPRTIKVILKPITSHWWLRRAYLAIDNWHQLFSNQSTYEQVGRDKVVRDVRRRGNNSCPVHVKASRSTQEPMCAGLRPRPA
jgi:hypothetical protein